MCWLVVRSGKWLAGQGHWKEWQELVTGGSVEWPLVQRERSFQSVSVQTLSSPSWPLCLGPARPGCRESYDFQHYTWSQCSQVHMSQVQDEKPALLSSHRSVFSEPSPLLVVIISMRQTSPVTCEFECSDEWHMSPIYT